MQDFWTKFRQPLTSAAFDAQAGQLAVWLASVFVLMLGLGKLCRLPLDEVQFFMGILLVLNITLVGFVIGLVLPLTLQAGRKTP